MHTAEMLIEHYGLLPHPEGGYYKETYRCKEIISQKNLPQRFKGDRSFSTAIYFLLKQENYSAFHRIKSDECWHFYAGDCLFIYVLHNDGQLETIRLGANISHGECFQFIVPAGCWFAAEPAPGTSYSFAGCTVAPGFDFADFELANANELSLLYPHHGTLIKRLTK